MISPPGWTRIAIHRQWGAHELPDEACRHGYDPRVLTENTGAERIESTQLGVANVLRSLVRLDEATRGNENEFTATYSVMLETQLRYLKSVGKMVGGAMPRFGARGGAPAAAVPAAEQSHALQRIAVVGGNLIISSVQADLVADVLSGSQLSILEEQSVVSPESYSPAQLGQDIDEVVWGDLSSAPPWRRAIQKGYVLQTAKLMEGWARRPLKSRW